MSTSQRGAAEHDHRFRCVSLVPIFATLPEEDRHRVASVARTRHHDRKELIYVPGDRLGLHIVHRGQVKVYRLTESGTEQLVRILGPGDFLGETALLSTVEADDFAVALRPSEVCSISRADIEQLLLDHPRVAIDLLEAVARRLHTADKLAASVSGLPVSERLARHLLELSDAAGSASVVLPSTKKDLAAHLGTTPETLSRRLAAMQDAGVIRLGPRRRVEVLDREALRAFG